MADTSAQTAAPSTQPTRKLPTDRIAFTKQLDIIRVYGLTSQGGTKAINYREVAQLVGLNANTVALMNTFMVDNNFVEKNGNDFIPARPLIEYAQAYSWAPETAARKLAPLVRRTWFGERLVTRLGFRTMTVEDAVADLASQVSASPDFKPQIETLVEYAVAAGLARRDGNQLALGDSGTSEASADAPPPPPKAKAAAELGDDAPPSPRASRSVATGFNTTEGRVQFHVSIDVSMQEMGGWTPDRISAFFSGLAQVLAAKKGAEEIE